MKIMMLIGETGAGKCSLIRALSGEEFPKKRNIAVEFRGQFINTPGEFLENRRFYRALITTAVDCDVLALIQDATRSSSLFPPQFATLFNRTVVGVVTKVDETSANVERAERFLRNAGAEDIIHVSTRTGVGLDTIRKMFI
ncbi:MAG: EutP/PduV family microcompartment system protein [Desulfovibrio sp.]|nr:EutP/PduV family microcompartment system protein [Desulfovibrio sp.]MBI4960614.1 EutP/PduV family microcompartment system protein [Desulfovibrio sp.]